MKYLAKVSAQFLLMIHSLLLGGNLLNAQPREEGQGEEEQMIISSGEAEYDGQEITLVGKVVVQHGLGKISAHRLTLLPSTSINKKNRFSLLKINEDIFIELQGGGSLQCQQAEVDYPKLQGFFLGSPQQPDVIYSNGGETSGHFVGPPSPLVVKSEQMQLEMIHQLIDGSSKTLVQSVQANHNVRVHYNQDYLLLADRAFYQRLPSQKSLAGVLTLSTQRHHPFCQLTNGNGDRIQAQTILVDTARRQLHLNSPRGILYVQKEGHSKQGIRFSSDELIWNDVDQLMHLKGHVHVNQSEVMQVKTDWDVYIQQADKEGKKEIRSIRSSQETELTYLDGKKGVTHKILCYGPLILNHENLEVWMQSPTDDQGEVLSGKQVYFEDLLGDMYADCMHMTYTWVDHQLTPSKILLEGHVQILNRFDGHLQESGFLLQYALADRVEYFPSNQEILLCGLNGNRVLFFDKVNNVKMSAPSLRIHRDERGQKSSIQGMGDVRFTFIEREFDQLRQRFRLDEQPQ